MSVGIYHQAKRLEGRNGSIYSAWCFGATQEAIAEEFSMSLSNVRRIIAQVERDLPEITRDEVRKRLLEATMTMSRSVLDIYNIDPAPVTDVKGGVVRDPDTGMVVRDYSSKLKAAETWLKISERIAKLAGSDMPMKYEVEHSANLAAIEQAEAVTGKFTALRAVS
jgi:hypothetical protein